VSDGHHQEVFAQDSGQKGRSNPEEDGRQEVGCR
jgi:hypothetical protein